MKGDTSATSPEAYIAGLEEPRRSEIASVDRLIRTLAPELQPVMVFGMLGYGPYRYRYESGREGDGAKICLASQKNYISLYCGAKALSLANEQVPKASMGKGCLRLKRLSDIDESLLAEIIQTSAQSEAPYAIQS